MDDVMRVAEWSFISDEELERLRTENRAYQITVQNLRLRLNRAHAHFAIRTANIQTERYRLRKHLEQAREAYLALERFAGTLRRSDVVIDVVAQGRIEEPKVSLKAPLGDSPKRRWNELKPWQRKRLRGDV